MNRNDMPILPFLISFYAVIALFAENISEVPPNVIWRPLLVLFLFVAILFFAFRGLMKDGQRSALTLGFLLLLFFTYGHAYIFLKDILHLKDVDVGGVHVFRHQSLTKIWLLVSVVGTILIYRIKNLAPFMQFANAMSIIMLLFPFYDIALYVSRENAFNTLPETQTTSLSLPAGDRAPDVYFIVLDAYGRADVLQRVFNLDNSKFIGDLQDMGFYVAQCSQSNYARTRLSIASTLNMDYIQNLAPSLKADEVNFWVKPYLINSQARVQFKALGYKIVSFYSGFPILEWKNADYYLRAGEKTSFRLQLATTLTPFEELFLNTTLVRAFIDLKLAGAQVSSDPTHRQSILYILETLPVIHKISGPKFVYAHLILPHPPFVFGPHGEEKNIGTSDDEVNDTVLYQDEAMRTGFRDQTLYTNQLIIPVLRSIIEESAVPPIIILESDHGPTGYGGSQNRMENLIAYYFPGRKTSELAYPFITPVNSFRLVFNTYFGGSYPLLKDVSYFSEATKDLDYEIVPNTCAGQ